MNTEQVVEMIDAITEGKRYDFKLNKDVTISIGDYITVYVDGIGAVAKTNDPRTAREIAGALVAWANRKDGIRDQNEEVSQIVRKPHVRNIELKPTTSIPEEVVKRQQALYERGGNSRADWYRRNVKNMSQEAKDRNLQDLRAIRDTVLDSSSEWADIQAAICLLLNAGAK